MNTGSYVLGWFKLSSGGIAGTVVDPRIIFMLVLKTNACKVILCHNHPSGNAKQSDSDVSLTKRIKDAGKLFEITLLDHIIVCPNGSYMSMADEGII
jgi:DNA repair protein RadC